MMHGIMHWILDATRWAAVFAGVIAIGLWSGLLGANWGRMHRDRTSRLPGILAFLSFGIVGLVLFGVGRLFELIAHDEPLRLIGGPTLLLLYLAIDIALYRAFITSHLYAMFEGAGAVSTTAVMRLKKVADAEHDAFRAMDRDLQAQIDALVTKLEPTNQELTATDAGLQDQIDVIVEESKT